MKQWLFCLALGALCFLFAPATAAQQRGRDPKDRIEFEGHFGFYGNATLPQARRENPEFTAFVNGVSSFQQLPLRPDLRSRKVRWQLGGRASYDLTARWAVEYTFTYTQGSNFRFSEDYLERALPAARARAFAFTELDLRGADGRLWIHSLNAVFHTRASGRLVPYLTGGVSAVRFGHGPRIIYFRGFDDFARVPSGASIDETAKFSYDNRFTRVGGNAGGGLKVYVRRHLGFRVDARLLFVDSQFTQRGDVRQDFWPFALVIPLFTERFRANITSEQSGLYSNLHLTFGVFTRF